MAKMYNNIDLSLLVPQKAFSRIAWLGKHDWLEVKASGGRNVTIDVKFPPPDSGIFIEDYRSIKRAVEFWHHYKSVKEIIWFWNISKTLSNGPKVFIPTLDQCEAMSNVSLDIPISEYSQPYESIIYVYPEDFCKTLAERLGLKRFPKMTVCHRDPIHKSIHVGSVFTQSDLIQAILPDRVGFTIEDILMGRSGEIDTNETEFDLAIMLQRIALNFSLMMTHFTVKDNPLYPETWNKHRMMAKQKDAKKRAKGISLSIGDIRLIEFEQNVKMYGTQGGDSIGGDLVGNVRPHWRKGHWRMQAHGPSNGLRKRVFIKPIMVKKSIFVGDAANTSVVYRG